MDVIGILDSAPIRPDMVEETNLVQLTNRAPISHLAIERGLKALISDAGGTDESIHALNKLYKDLEHRDRKSADFLAAAFQDAVQFFGYDVRAKGFRHFASIDKYLSKVGTKGVFDALRYWAIGKPGKGERLIHFISLPIHRELLYALWCLLSDDNPDPQTVLGRVERTVTQAMFEGRDLIWSSEDLKRKQSIRWYIDWLNDHDTRRGALQEAVSKGLTIGDDEFVNQALRDAYNQLKQSGDPAVLYFVHTLTYLPKGSQRPNPDAVPQVEWLGRNRTDGLVSTSGGTHLGHIKKYADGGWGITPMEEGLVRVTDTARSLEDAKHYLVNRCTIKIAVEKDGESRCLRVVKKRVYSKNGARYSSDIPRPPTYQFDFWDDKHGLIPGESVSVRLPMGKSHQFEHVIKGEVTGVSQQSVSISGTSCYDTKRDP